MDAHNNILQGKIKQINQIKCKLESSLNQLGNIPILKNRINDAITIIQILRQAMKYNYYQACQFYCDFQNYEQYAHNKVSQLSKSYQKYISQMKNDYLRQINELSTELQKQYKITKMAHQEIENMKLKIKKQKKQITTEEQQFQQQKKHNNHYQNIGLQIIPEVQQTVSTRRNHMIQTNHIKIQQQNNIQRQFMKDKTKSMINLDNIKKSVQKNNSKWCSYSTQKKQHTFFQQNKHQKNIQYFIKQYTPNNLKQSRSSANSNKYDADAKQRRSLLDQMNIKINIQPKKLSKNNNQNKENRDIDKQQKYKLLIKNIMKIKQKQNTNHKLQNSSYYHLEVGQPKLQIKYQGPRKNGKKNGRGILFYTNGLTYQGDFINNQRCGYGILKHNNFQIYKGDWDNDMINGRGRIKNCTILGKKNKYMTGLYCWSQYIGQFKNNKFNGTGTLILQKGQKFLGKFKNGLAEGQGTYYSNNNNDIQFGIWRNNNLVQKI